MNNIFDVAVIGGGPGGYIAAIRCAQLGFKTVCIDMRSGKDEEPALGGTCLNNGCIPYKALLESSEHFHALTHDFKEHGISIGQAEINVPQMMERKDLIISRLTQGIAFLFKKNKVESIHSTAQIVGLDHQDMWDLITLGGHKIKAQHVILATGSRPRPLEGATVDHQVILNNESALNLTEVPKKLGIIGSGVIGLEMGSIWNRLGSEVTILEAMPKFLAMADQQLAAEAQKVLTKQGLNIVLDVKIEKVTNNGSDVTVDYSVNGEKKYEVFDKLVVAIGRVPNTTYLNAESIGLKLDSRGFIEVDDECRTNLPNVWAIGDVVRGPMLAHKASEEGVAVAERIAGQKPQVHLDRIPSVVYTTPEMAWVGKTEEQLQEEGIAYKKGQSNFAANGRALGMGQGQGFVKVLTDANTDRILGVHMIGPMVSELISEAVVAMEFSASGEDIARIVHAHPTLSEVLHEAALASDGRALHG
ncbi:MAG: dihydrolipoyl dehydrogenase [Neisseriaceae bacterium]|nr:dihydrolipoyl dehydrogenase [Neisseriaceae bacterium]